MKKNTLNFFEICYTLLSDRVSKKRVPIELSFYKGILARVFKLCTTVLWAESRIF